MAELEEIDAWHERVGRKELMGDSAPGSLYLLRWIREGPWGEAAQHVIWQVRERQGKGMAWHGMHAVRMSLSSWSICGALHLRHPGMPRNHALYNWKTNPREEM